MNNDPLFFGGFLFGRLELPEFYSNLNRKCRNSQVHEHVGKYVPTYLDWEIQITIYVGTYYSYTRGKSLLELWVTTFHPNWQPPLIFVWFMSNFLWICSNSMASAHVILKYVNQTKIRVAVSWEEKWYPTILRVICL